MKIYFNKVCFLKRKLIKKLFEKALEKTENNVENLAVNVSFVGEDEIRRLNKEFRNIDKVTDVLSFPMLEIKEPMKLADFESERDIGGTLEIGDIAICTRRARQQAKEFGNTYKRELAFLALHGFLHLLGYDHIEKADEKKMMTMAEDILAEEKIKRGRNV